MRGAIRCLQLWIAVAVLAGGVPACLSAQELPADLKVQVDRWYRTARRVAPGSWGIAISDQSGQILWSANPDIPLIPASTVKLLTTGYARTVIGGEARLATRVVGAGDIDSTGEWIGRWALEVNGDPTLESPDGHGPRLQDLADQLANSGIHRIRGPFTVVTGDGSAPEAVYPAAWRPANWGTLYAPLVGALTIHENIVRISIRGGTKAGRRAVLAGTSPAGIGALIDIHATTTSGRRSRLYVRRMADGGYLVTGTVGLQSGIRTLTAVAGDTKAVFAAAWARALEQAGIEWDRSPATEIETADTNRVLAQIESAPFDSLALEINRRSLNLGAELLLRWAGGTERGPDLLTEHVQQVAGVVGGVRLVDGSGMSHDDRVTPATFIYYMANVQHTPAGRNFPYLLPANGQGTLARLASGLPGQGVVRAKTGTLAGVSTLVGYLGRRDGMFLISLMYNGPRSRTAKRQQWSAFRLLGAGGTEIPPDSEMDMTEPVVELGGESTAP
jgi:D-alanyl-D-alanine carboxypeptidase/D-alanyl-D-alanine-endopeptidase (penicillin-binding protein 4)